MLHQINEQWNGPERRLLIVRWAVCLGFLAAIAISFPLWFGTRSFPMVPALGFVPQVPQVVSSVLSVGLVLSLVAAALASRVILLVALPIVGLLVLLDINRLQPWVFEYILLLAGLSINDRERAWAACAVVVSATYIWGGVQKLNIVFATEIFPWLVRPLVEHVGVTAGFLAAMIEVAIGLLLLVRGWRRIGVVVAVLMHGFVLAMLGPLGHNFNPVIWPWNVAMPLIVAAMFAGDPGQVFISAWKATTGKLLVVLAGFMPVLSFISLWDHNLSFSLYSGRAPEGLLKVPKGAGKSLSMPVANTAADGSLIVDISAWSLADCGVPAYPATRAYRAVAGQMGAELYVRSRANKLGAERQFIRDR